MRSSSRATWRRAGGRRRGRCRSRALRAPRRVGQQRRRAARRRRSPEMTAERVRRRRRRQPRRPCSTARGPRRRGCADGGGDRQRRVDRGAPAAPPGTATMPRRRRRSSPTPGPPPSSSARRGSGSTRSAPGLIDRPGLADDWPDGVARWEAACPLGRLGDAGRTSATPACSSPRRRARWITGARARRRRRGVRDRALVKVVPLHRRAGRGAVACGETMSSPRPDPPLPRRRVSRQPLPRAPGAVVAVIVGGGFGVVRVAGALGGEEDQAADVVDITAAPTTTTRPAPLTEVTAVPSDSFEDSSSEDVEDETPTEPPTTRRRWRRRRRRRPRRQHPRPPSRRRRRPRIPPRCSSSATATPASGDRRSESTLEETGVVQVEVDYLMGSGLAQPRDFDWLAARRRAAPRRRPRRRRHVSAATTSPRARPPPTAHWSSATP